MKIGEKNIGSIDRVARVAIGVLLLLIVFSLYIAPEYVKCPALPPGTGGCTLEIKPSVCAVIAQSDGSQAYEWSDACNACVFKKAAGYYKPFYYEFYSNYNALPMAAYFVSLVAHLLIGCNPFPGAYVVGLVGLIALAEGIFGSCALYSLLGINTRKAKKR